MCILIAPFEMSYVESWLVMKLIALWVDIKCFGDSFYEIYFDVLKMDFARWIARIVLSSYNVNLLLSSLGFSGMFFTINCQSRYRTGKTLFWGSLFLRIFVKPPFFSKNFAPRWSVSNLKQVVLTRGQHWTTDIMLSDHLAPYPMGLDD